MTVPFSSYQNFARGSVGGYVDGTWTETTPATTASVKCCIQPYRAGENAIAPRVGGRWTDGMVSIDAESAIYPDKGGAMGDRFVYDGDLYEVMSAEKYVYGMSTDHWEGYGQKINDNTNQ